MVADYATFKDRAELNICDEMTEHWKKFRKVLQDAETRANSDID